MTRTTLHTPRPGVTLIEVLVAIFVMAIGLMALLTLFPLGALNMAQAIKDDRTGTASQNAAAVARGVWRELCSGAIPGPDPANPDPTMSWAMLDPDYDPITLSDGPMLTRANARGPSYPVFIDGVGFTSYSGNYKTWLGGNNNNGLPRRSLEVVLNTSINYQEMLTRHYFTLRDDIVFGKNGLAEGFEISSGTPVTVQREGRYSWSFLLRRPRVSDARTLDITVVVYSGRALDLVAGSLQPTGETAYTGQFFQGSTLAYIDWNSANQTTPVLRRGGWIMDATMVKGMTDPNQDPNGFFYRIANYSDPIDQGGGNFRIELELRTNAQANATISVGTTSGIAIIMPDVVEVFEKGFLFP